MLEMNTEHLLLSFALGSICLAIYPIMRKLLSATPNRAIPPGPAGVPILGNILNNPARASEPYKNWSSLYGKIASFSLMNQTIYVLNSREYAYELLDKRASNYADRPRQIMCGELMSWNRGIALCPGGVRHKTYRRLVNRTLSATATQRLWPIQVQAARQFVSSLVRDSLESSENISKSGYETIDSLRRSVGMNVVEIIFGGSSSSDPTAGMNEKDMEDYIQAADYAHSLFAKALIPFAYMVDWVPWLTFLPENIPFVKFKRDARTARRGLEELTMGPYMKTRERILRGIVQSSYLDSCFASNRHPTPEEEEDFAWTAMSAYTGGSDTTISAIMTILLAAATNPNAQRLVHEELDNIIGPDRLPDLQDRANLPYLGAFIQECMRSRPVVPLGVPHQAAEEDTIDGYYIPQSATIVANIRGMLNDPDIYQSPTKFEPERFLPTNGTPTNPDIRGRSEPEIGHLHFGFGRRICPGLHLATSGVWIYAATLFWAFSISPVEDDSPSSTPLSWETAKFSEGAILYPMPFKVNLASRFPNAADVIRNTK